MTTSLAVLFSFNEAVVMVAVFLVLFGLPLFTIFKRMKMEDRRIEKEKRLQRKPPPKTIDGTSPSQPSAPSAPSENSSG